MEILDVIIDTHGLIYKVQTQNGHVFEHTLAKDTPPDKVAQVLRLLATHVDQLEAEKANNN
ncbi:hypothetical protein E2556_04910 [Staphylococcus croceilyticus]|uniref:Phage protein n=2 Tax=Staphylococcus TaxID=1279 RepID=A0A380FZL7_9STAP|nr:MULTISPECIES: hypothetical protein [Staphylococcus]MCI2773145.1 hypothetical protein [Staphylococcus petrasii]PNZ25863.1 hypothetical protein CD137_10370 [Staphylococcus petrasii]PNZ69882.1 hypothetical protein CD128_04100 [Staphylococcus croceilyticus]PNZ80163.1 hypothetical protein CD127_11225 [Staphylococcus petrasii]TGA79938.1 hypothetical protein E2556_04910 [Staphylococcus croceilyticus]